MIFPHQKFTLVIKGDVAFVKDKETGRTLGLWKNGEYYEYRNTKHISERKNCNGNKKD